MDLQFLVRSQHEYFATGQTRPVEFRLEALSKLQTYIQKNEQAIFGSLQADLGKAAMESYMTEVGIVLEEIRYVKKES